MTTETETTETYVLTVTPDALERVLEIREAGAVDYVRKARMEDDLVAALVGAIRNR